MAFLKMLVKRMLVLLALYQLCRIAFLLFNYHYFKGLTPGGLGNIIWGGTRFDLSALMYLNVIYIFMFILPFNFRYAGWYRRVAKFIFVFTNGMGIAANLIDCAYFLFLFRRTNASFFLEFKNDTNLLWQWNKFAFSYWYIALLIAVFIGALSKLYDYIKMPDKRPEKRIIIADIAYLPFIVIVWLGLARGSFVPSNRPINISYAGDYVTNPNQLSLVINTPFSIMMTWGNIKIPPVAYYPSLQSASAVYSPVQAYPKSDRPHKNVVIIVVESLSREFVGALNDKSPGYRGYTPFLDSLIQQSLAFRYGFANGKRSIEALPSVVASIPSYTEAYALTPYSGNQINSIASVLKKHSYHTSFFHGAVEGSLGLSGFMKIAGVDNTYSKKDYNNDNDYDGTWGVYDGDFMQYWAGRLNTFPQPFFSTLFTLSMHHPFKIPARYEGSFDKGTLPIHRTVQYFDLSLKQFFAAASKMPWYKNTLFVITADHAAPDQYYGYSRTSAGAFAIPIIFYTPDSSLTGFRNELVQQCDIFPTIINYLGMDDTILSFGTSVFRPDPAHFVVNYNSGLYQAFQGDFLLQFDGNAPFALYRYKDDGLLQNNLLGKYPVIEKDMLVKLKAYIQQYVTRVRENKMMP